MRSFATVVEKAATDSVAGFNYKYEQMLLISQATNGGAGCRPVYGVPAITMAAFGVMSFRRGICPIRFPLTYAPQHLAMRRENVLRCTSGIHQ